MAQHTTAEDQKAKIREMINHIGAGMMTTLSREGTFHARPMQNADVEDGFTSVWFATQRHSGKIEEVSQDARVGLTYVDSTGKGWVSLSGHAQVVDDRAKSREVWRDTWKNWFDGPEDPEMILIEVTPEIGEYWDQDAKAIVYAKLATSAVTGKQFELGENKKVEFHD